VSCREHRLVRRQGDVAVIIAGRDQHRGIAGRRRERPIPIDTGTPNRSAPRAVRCGAAASMPRRRTSHPQRFRTTAILSPPQRRARVDEPPPRPRKRSRKLADGRDIGFDLDVDCPCARGEAERMGAGLRLVARRCHRPPEVVPTRKVNGPCRPRSAARVPWPGRPARTVVVDVAVENDPARLPTIVDGRPRPDGDVAPVAGAPINTPSEVPCETRVIGASLTSPQRRVGELEERRVG
jgi:hypothetical protein